LTCSGSDKPGVVVAQLETTDGKVLGSTKFIYKEEISTGFQKLVCSKNYGGRFLKALSLAETKKDPPPNSQTKTSPGMEEPLRSGHLSKFVQYVPSWETHSTQDKYDRDGRAY